MHIFIETCHNFYPPKTSQATWLVTPWQVKVVRGGKLKARKGVNVPDVEIDCAALTAKESREEALGK